MHYINNTNTLIVINFNEGNDEMLENEMLDPEDEILDGPDPEDEILDPETNDVINLTVWFTYDVPSLIYCLHNNIIELMNEEAIYCTCRTPYDGR